MRLKVLAHCTDILTVLAQAVKPQTSALTLLNGKNVLGRNNKHVLPYFYCLFLNSSSMYLRISPPPIEFLLPVYFTKQYCGASGLGVKQQS